MGFRFSGGRAGLRFSGGGHREEKRGKGGIRREQHEKREIRVGVDYGRGEEEKGRRSVCG